MGTRGRCSYCLREATTKDHVVPRCLLEKPYPPNLLTIPSCCECNTGFKQDEEYFLAVMAQSGFAPTLMSKVDENRAVDRMLQKSPGLDTLIQGSLHAAEDGRVYITPDEVRIAKVSLPSENVLNVPSRNVLLTESPWKGEQARASGAHRGDTPADTLS